MRLNDINDINNASLHNDCVRMLKRPSRIKLVDSIMLKLFGEDTSKDTSQDTSQDINKYCLYEKILLFCKCNINN